MPARSTRELLPGFAALLCAHRHARRWMTTHLARVAGVSPSTVSDIEHERRAPSLRIAAKLAKALGLKVRLDKLADADYLKEQMPQPAAEAKAAR